MSDARDAASWHARTTVRKYIEDAAPWVDALGDEGIALFEDSHRPYEELVVEGNILVNVGIQAMLDFLIGAGSPVAYNATNARIGVGDSTTAAAATQTDLQAATNKLRKGMDATFPSRASQTISFKSSFTSAEANYAWQEWAVFSSATANTGMLNRKVESLGTKTTGTWTLQVDITVS